MINKVNVAAIVSSQFPGFIREDYTTFVAFVQAYYDFLLQSQCSPVNFSENGWLISREDHKYVNGNQIKFYNIKNVIGIIEAQSYYVISSTINTFQISATYGGPAISFVNDGSATLLQDPDLKTIRDIDTTLDEYIRHFKSEYASNIPFVLPNERFVLSNIKDLNLAKGSEESFKLLFRLLYDKEIQIGYPGKQMLRASDGRWEQKISIFVQVIKGNPNDIVNKTIEIVTSSGNISTLLYSYRELTVFSEGEEIPLIIDGGKVYELSIDRRFFGNVKIGDRVLRDGDGTFISRVVPTISKINITQGGKNFNVGELYEIGTTGTLLKVVKTDNDGAILFAQIINYSMDQKYTDGFSYQIVSKEDVAKNLSVENFTITAPSIHQKDITIDDITNGWFESGTLNTYDYNIDTDPLGEAFQHNYAGKLLRQFITSDITTTIDIGNSAIVEFQLGAISKYPGFYSGNSGFLDDAMYIQDSKFYQTFSYIISVSETLESYKTAVKTMIHPSGVALFGEYTISNELDLTTDLESMLQSLIVILKDHILITTGTPNFVVDKLLNSTHKLSDNSTVDNESFSLTDQQLVYKNGSALYYKYDEQSLLDSGEIWLDNYLDDMTLFANDGSHDYMSGKTIF